MHSLSAWRRRVSALVVVVGLFAFASIAKADYVSNRVLVKFKPGLNASGRETLVDGVGGAFVDSLFGYYVIQLADTSVIASATSLGGEDSVVVAHSDDYLAPAEVSLLGTVPNDDAYPDLVHLNNTGQDIGTAGADIRAEKGWDYIRESPNVVIAVIDGGTDYYASDLIPNLWKNPGESGSGKETNSTDDDNNGYVDDVYGWNFVNNNNDPWSNCTHGTASASFAAAKGNNDNAFTGVTWSAKIMSLKAFGTYECVGTSEYNFSKAVDYAVDNGANIINCSFRGTFPAGLFKASIDAASAAGLLITAGAGNDGDDNDGADSTSTRPASYNTPGVLTVAMTDQDDVLANPCFYDDTKASNYGATSVDLAAPGCDLLAMYNGDEINGPHSGTSISAPIGAGAAALLWAQHPTWTNLQVKARLMSTIDTLASCSGKMVAPGRINLGRALDNIPPSKVTFTFERGNHSAKAMWTETGDDTTDGTATVADVRWSATTRLTNETAFNAATPVPLDLPLAGSGTEHCVMFTSLSQGHKYYIAVRLEDGEFNWSAIASDSVTTLGGGNFEVEDCPVANRPAEARTPVRPTDESTLVWALGSARPNPTTGVATIEYSVKVGGPVAIGVYNVAGRLVRNLVNDTQTPGNHTVVWDGTSADGSKVGGGVYFYRMVANGWHSDRRLVVLGQ